jgi:putative DNA primase/helicase
MFEAWDEMIRRPLIWLGMADPVATQDALYDDDDTEDSIGGRLSMLHQLFGDRHFTAKDIERTILLASDNPTASPGRQWAQELRATFEDENGKVAGAKGIGMWLKGQRKRIADGLKLNGKRDTSTNTAVYWLTKN